MKDFIDKNSLENEHVYHIVSRSIAGYKIFNTDRDYSRMIKMLRFYQIHNNVIKFSIFNRLKSTQNLGFNQNFSRLFGDYGKMVNIISYCLMPNHIHLVLKQLENKGISNFMSNILNSYTRYFNILHRRKGPLWETRFKHILVDTDEQLLHLTRYIHLNPYSAKLINKPDLWKFYSYHEYINPDQDDRITDYQDLLHIDPKDYRKFVDDQKDYQRRLSEIKKIINP